MCYATVELGQEDEVFVMQGLLAVISTCLLMNIGIMTELSAVGEYSVTNRKLMTTPPGLFRYSCIGPGF